MKNIVLRSGFTTALICLLLAGASGCTNLARPQITPTLDMTQVYATVSAMLTSTLAAQQRPPHTVTPSPAQLAASPTPEPSHQPGTPTLVVSAAVVMPSPTAKIETPVLPCDQAAAGMPIDVTIPDDTEMRPGENFIKIWKLQNAGSCTWTTEYDAFFFYGDRMGAPTSVPLSASVSPGKTVEISVEMTAPDTPGTYQGNWKLRNAAGEFFGIGPAGDSPFWVRIVVVRQASATPTATFIPTSTATPSPIPTETPTATPTPPVRASVTLELVPNDVIDLDDGKLNPNYDADVAYQTGESDLHWLLLKDGAQLGIYGSMEPGLLDCQAANMSSAPVPVESLPAGIYLCFHSNDNRYGRLQLVQFDPTSFALTISILTWTGP